ncbi:GNAT family N-acetyltransferase [Azospirillum halopraeferens]|uniref:GNAT family N-acetyltransferase n=1 Tax=Azospirillum halopraeferens TaxID=34010 RepID=UPI0003F8F5FE|nr:N-acetyltransferase [Azospirillum halopraeferens]
MSDPVALRPAGPFDAAVVAALQHVCFPEEPWSAGFIATLLGQPGTFGRLAVADTGGDPRPAGFVLARVAGEDGEILAIGVPPGTRRAGVGRRLIGEALLEMQRLGATAVFLEVAEDNMPARALYKAAGFVAVGRRPGYYKRPNGRVTALVLRHPPPPVP